MDVRLLNWDNMLLCACVWHEYAPTLLPPAWSDQIKWLIHRAHRFFLLVCVRVLCVCVNAVMLVLQTVAMSVTVSERGCGWLTGPLPAGCVQWAVPGEEQHADLARTN